MLLTIFGFFSVTAGLVCYALEQRSHWYQLGFAITCAFGSIYGFLQGAWPFGMVEIVWTIVAFKKWMDRPATQASFTPQKVDCRS